MMAAVSFAFDANMLVKSAIFALVWGLFGGCCVRYCYRIFVYIIGTWPTRNVCCYCVFSRSHKLLAFWVIAYFVGFLFAFVFGLLVLSYATPSTDFMGPSAVQEAATAWAILIICSVALGFVSCCKAWKAQRVIVMLITSYVGAWMFFGPICLLAGSQSSQYTVVMVFAAAGFAIQYKKTGTTPLSSDKRTVSSAWRVLKSDVASMASGFSSAATNDGQKIPPPGETFDVICPEGSMPGSKLSVVSPSGQTIEVLVPVGIKGGQQFPVTAPAALPTNTTTTTAHPMEVATQPPLLLTTTNPMEVATLDPPLLTSI
jgi:hypothetical protein